MGYNELLKQAQEHPNAPIQISLADLLECNRQLFEIMRREFMSAYRALHQEKMMSREEVSQLLGVDLSTLYRWNKKGVLKAHRVGGKVLYSSEDVKQIINAKNIG